MKQSKASSPQPDPYALEYARPADTDMLTVERIGNALTLSVPYTGPWPPTFKWLRTLYELPLAGDLGALVLWPLIGIFHLIFRGIFRMLRPQRPSLIWMSVDPQWVRLDIFDRDTGRIRRFDWPREDVQTLRSNRFGTGLWVRVKGEIGRNVIERLDPGILRWVDEQLLEVGLGKTAQQREASASIE